MNFSQEELKTNKLQKSHICEYYTRKYEGYWKETGEILRGGGGATQQKDWRQLPGGEHQLSPAVRQTAHVHKLTQRS